MRLVYERGAFTESDVTVVAGCLAAFSLGLVFNGWMLMMTRGFYGLQSNWLPTVIARRHARASTPSSTSRSTRVGVWGIPLATSLVNIVGVALLVFFLRRRVGGLDLARVTDAIVRITLASVVLGAVAFGVWYALDDALGRSIVAQIVSLGAALARRRRRLPRRLPAAPRARARCAAADGVAPLGLSARCVGRDAVGSRR